MSTAAPVAHAPVALPPGVALMPTADMPWKMTPSGREIAYVQGHPDRPGPYVMFVRWPPGNRALGHCHTGDRFGLVVEGRHYIGYGDRFDKAKLHEHTAGTYFTEPAYSPHFGETRDEGAILCFFGIGPSGNQPIEQE